MSTTFIPSCINCGFVGARTYVNSDGPYCFRCAQLQLWTRPIPPPTDWPGGKPPGYQFAPSGVRNAADIAEIERLTQERDALAASLRDANAEIERMKRELDAHRAEIQSLCVERKDAERVIVRLGEVRDALAAECDRLRRELDEANGVVR